MPGAPSGASVEESGRDRQGQARDDVGVVADTQVEPAALLDAEVRRSYHGIM